MYRSRLAYVLAMAGLAALLVPSSLTAQITFQLTYGGANRDAAYRVLQTSDGGYILAGETRSFGAGSADAYLIKVGASGDTQWTRTYGGVGYDGATSVQHTADGGYILVGVTIGANHEDVYLVRTDSSGDTLWSRAYGRGPGTIDRAEEVQQTADGGFIIAGNVGDAPDADVLLIRTNAGGDTLWTRTFGEPNYGDYANSVRQTADRGSIVVGYTHSHGAGRLDVFLIKLDSVGDTLWTRTFGDTAHDRGYAVEQTADSGYIIAGYTTIGAGNLKVYLVKTDANGDSLWTRTIGRGEDDLGGSVQQTADGGYVVCGWTGSSGDADLYLVRTDPNGDTLWTRAYGGSQRDAGYSVRQTSDGGFIVAGETQSFGAGGSDVYLIKTDSLGNVVVPVAEPKASPTPTAAMSLTCEPNPFSGATTIRLSPFAIGHSPLTLRIYDAQGRAVRSFSSLLSAPSSLTWDGTDDLGQPLPLGAYFVRVNGGNEHATTRIVLQR